MLRNLVDRFLSLSVLVPQTLSASVDSAAQDMQGKRNFAFMVHVGSFAFSGANSLTHTILESDTFGGTYTANAASGSLVLNDQASQENKTHMLEYKGTKRYIKLSVVEAGTVSVPYAASGVCTELEDQH